MLVLRTPLSSVQPEWCCSLSLTATSQSLCPLTLILLLTSSNLLCRTRTFSQLISLITSIQYTNIHIRRHNLTTTYMLNTPSYNTHPTLHTTKNFYPSTKKALPATFSFFFFCIEENKSANTAYVLGNLQRILLPSSSSYFLFTPWKYHRVNPTATRLISCMRSSWTKIFTKTRPNLLLLLVLYYQDLAHKIWVTYPRNFHNSMLWISKEVHIRKVVATKEWFSL